jgi:hypothetical protein
VIARMFGLTAFVAAALLFTVEPMVAKALLPTLGGSASVWATCLAFFQVALLVGYGYAHATSRLSPRVQAAVHGVLLVSCVALRPTIVIGPGEQPGPEGDPAWWLLASLTATVGLPFIALAATSSLLQRWYAATRPTGEADPYPLYAASNLGSLLALLAYPLLIEPGHALNLQARGWWAGFVGFAGLMGACAIVAGRAANHEIAARSQTVSYRAWPLWIALGFVPSSLMQGVTTYLSTDIAPIPLLWVIPLALYLLSFVITFGRRPERFRTLMIRLLPYAGLALLPSIAAGLVDWYWLPIHLLFFFVAAMVCHGELSRRRPPAAGLTGFYLAISLGGVLGSLFNAFLATALFDRSAEYPIGIVMACLVLATIPRPGVRPEQPRTAILFAATILGLTALLAADPGQVSATAFGALSVMMASGTFVYVAWTHRRRPLAFALSVGAVVAGLGLSPGKDGRVLLRDRNFYGLVRVTQDDRAMVRRLFHGWTLHGQQSIELGHEREPTTYYLPGGPGAQIFDALNARNDSSKARVAVVGLGIGALAAYAKEGQAWTFYELDPAIERIATDPRLFTYLRDSRATVEVILGDARLRLANAPEHRFDLIVLDAFASDAIPVHLLTREAMAVYLDKLHPGGCVAFHISNKYLNLEPVIDGLARERGMVSRIRRDLEISREERKAGKKGTIWVVIAENARDLGAIADDPRWIPTRAGRGAWTDERSSLVECLKGGWWTPAE